MKLARIAFCASLLFGALTLEAQQPTWSSGTYAYDGNGNIVAIGTDTFAYDTANRLLSGTAGGGRTQTYRYDAFGNRTQAITDGQNNTALVPGVDQNTNRITLPVGQTTASGLVVTATGQYDGAGNMTGYQNGLYSFTYDGLNMLKDYQGGGRHEIYIYTPDNERIAVATVSGSGTNATVNSTRWTIRGLDNKVLREFDDSNPSGGHLWSWKEDWVYASGQLIAAENDQPDHTLHFFSDHLGTPRLITGSGGAVISRHTYYPFGEEATSPSQDAEVMKFTGHERDSLLDYMHARFTNAALGRFLSVDPVIDSRAMSSPQAWNRYAYVMNNPLVLLDPDGRDVEYADDYSRRTANGARAIDPATDRALIRLENDPTRHLLVKTGDVTNRGIGLTLAITRTQRTDDPDALPTNFQIVLDQSKIEARDQDPEGIFIHEVVGHLVPNEATTTRQMDATTPEQREQVAQQRTVKEFEQYIPKKDWPRLPHGHLQPQRNKPPEIPKDKERDPCTP